MVRRGKAGRFFHNGPRKEPYYSRECLGISSYRSFYDYPSYENALLWHERDLANSSSERFTLSHAMILLDDILAKSDKVMGKCVVDVES